MQSRQRTVDRVGSVKKALRNGGGMGLQADAIPGGIDARGLFREYVLAGVDGTADGAGRIKDQLSNSRLELDGGGGRIGSESKDLPGPVARE